MNKSIIDKEILTVKDVGNFLRIGTNAAYNLIHSKDFPVIKIGQCYRVPTKAFLKWVENESEVREGKTKW